jgi:L-lactate dehydrogenase complex protein LldG
MTESKQTAFIHNIRKALKHTHADDTRLEGLIQSSPEKADKTVLSQIRDRDHKARLKLLERLIQIGQSLNVAVTAAQTAASISESIREIAKNSDAEWGDQKSVVAWNHPLINRLELSAALEPLNIPVHVPQTPADGSENSPFRSQAETAMIGVTTADFGLAATATLTMKTRKGQPLYVSLLPSIHIAVIRLDQILSNLKELYTLLKWDPDQQKEGITNTMTFITGPSKTADIEATMVHGAHGPREVHIFVLKG